MDYEEITKIACSMMEEHGLFLKGWTFEFDNAVKRLGCTHYGSRKITVSRKASVLMTDYELRQIMLHEIAHALAGSKAKHSKVWKDMANSIGYELGVKLKFQQHQETYDTLLRRDKNKVERIRARDNHTGSTTMIVGSVVVYKLEEFEVEAIYRKFARVKSLKDGKCYKIIIAYIAETVIYNPTPRLVRA